LKAARDGALVHVEAPDQRGAQDMKELTTMNRPTTLFGALRPAALLLLVGLVVVTTMLAAAALNGGRGNTVIGAPPPSDPPSTPPVTTPSPVSTDGGQDAIPLRIDLDDLIGHNVYVDIVDSTGLLESAESGTPTASTPVEPYTLLVENIDAQTLRLTWVDRPGDNALALYIDETDAGYRLLMIQPEHDTDGDTILHDRVLILEFSQPISVDEIEPWLQEGLDVPG
jgi:hypothetical protein